MPAVKAFALAALLGHFVLAAPDPLAEAEKLLAQRDYRRAELVLREILKTEPSNARVHGNLALALLEQGKTREAIDEGRLAAAFGPAEPEARYIYGLALLGGGRPIEAARELEKVVQQRPEAVGPLARLAAAYAAAGDERTAATYEKLIVLEPRSESRRAELAEYLWRSEKYAEGNRIIEEARKAFPGSADLALRQGRALAFQDRVVDAIASLEAARRLGAADAAAFELLARSYERNDEREAARTVLEEGVIEHPDDPELLSDLGRLLLAQGRDEEALPLLERAARVPGAAASVQLDLGRALEAAGRPEAAEAAYRRAIQLSPNLPGAHFALGRLLQRQGRREEAERELATHHRLYELGLERVAAADARSAEITLAWAELNHGTATAALEKFRALPETAEVLRGRGLALSRLDRHSEAATAFERALELSPGDARIELLLLTERSRAAGRP
jgi:Flp pilus assembly protein TadD